jgi:hypothetical protein
MSSEEELDHDDYDEDDEEEVEEDAPVAKKRRAKQGGKKKKDPNKPKRNMSAFFLYSNANRAQIKDQNPSASFGNLVGFLALIRTTEKQKATISFTWYSISKISHLSLLSVFLFFCTHT